MTDSVTVRVLVAAGRSIEHRGLGATTLDVVAHEAGVSRATLYRHFPNGRQQIIDEVVVYEVGRFFDDLYRAVEGLTTIEDVLERGLAHAHRAVARHFLLHRVLREDPAMLDPGLTVAMAPIHGRVIEFLRPFLGRGAANDERADVLARMVLDYISTQGRWSLDDPVQTHVLVRDELLSWRGARTRHYPPTHARAMRRVRDMSLRGRLIDATAEEIAAGRYDQFTAESLARRTHVSRATMYRSAPGGRQALIEGVVDREAARLFAAVADAMVSEDSLHGCILAGLTTLWCHVASHATIAGFLASDPEMVRRHLRFDAAERTYFVASSFAQPLLGRWIDAERAGRLAEWMCRVTVSYWLMPAPYLNVADASSVATFYSRHLAPGIDALSGSL